MIGEITKGKTPQCDRSPAGFVSMSFHKEYSLGDIAFIPHRARERPHAGVPGRCGQNRLRDKLAARAPFTQYEECRLHIFQRAQADCRAESDDRVFWRGQIWAEANTRVVTADGGGEMQFECDPR